MFFGTSFKDAAIKAMAYNMRCCRYACDASANDGDLGSLEVCMGRRRSWGEDLVQDPLEELICEEDGALYHVQNQAAEPHYVRRNRMPKDLDKQQRRMPEESILKCWGFTPDPQ